MGARAAHWLTLTVAALARCRSRTRNPSTNALRRLTLRTATRSPCRAQPGFISAHAPQPKKRFAARESIRRKPTARPRAAGSGRRLRERGRRAPSATPFDFWAPRLTRAGAYRPVASRRLSVRAATMRRTRAACLPRAAMRSSRSNFRSNRPLDPSIAMSPPQQAHYIASKFRPRPVPDQSRSADRREGEEARRAAAARPRGGAGGVELQSERYRPRRRPSA